MKNVKQTFEIFPLGARLLFNTNLFYIVFISELVYLILYGEIIHRGVQLFFFFYNVILRNLNRKPEKVM